MKYDGGYASDNSSSISTPEFDPGDQCSSLITVKFLEDIKKDGSSVKYTIDIYMNGLKHVTIVREYDDFIYLHHCVVTSQLIHGIIVPPLPALSPSDAHGAEANSKSQMGKNIKTLVGDDFKRDCTRLQRYLEHLLIHPILAKNEKLIAFLMEVHPPPRVKVQKNLLTQIVSYFDGCKSSYPDCEEFFQKQRDWLLKYIPAFLSFTTDFQSVMNSQFRLIHEMEQLKIVLKLFHGNDTRKYDAARSSVLSVFFILIEDLKNELVRKATWEQNECCSSFLFWEDHLHAQESMLHQRTHLMIEYQACNKALDKAKPNRKEMAEKTKQEAEKAFENCSDVARQELKRVQRQRAVELQLLVSHYLNFQMGVANQCLRIVLNSLREVTSKESST